MKNHQRKGFTTLEIDRIIGNALLLVKDKIPNHKKSLTGFTLIELLIVVAIVAILSAIAIPNYLNAQTRAKVSKVMAEERTIATAMECYLVDNNEYPCTCVCELLSTPIAYITTIPNDPFCRNEPMPYMTTKCMRMQSFCINSLGPDGWSSWNPEMWMCGKPMTYPLAYDPTNGTVSNGDIYRHTKGG